MYIYIYLDNVIKNNIIIFLSIHLDLDDRFNIRQT